MKYDAIYARQSVDRLDSISIESQIEYCRYETRGGEFRVFQDKGYSGKNTDRPNFQLMLEAIRRGEVERVIVYKLDRISRSILDFATMMAQFQENKVEFVSCTEKFDTSTPMGRAMLNICIVFAQLERETIQQRVTDAYVSRSRKGFYMGGRIPYGYQLETHMIEGKKTSRYAAVPEEAEIVKQIFSMYAQPQTSFRDIVCYLTDHGIPNVKGKGGVWDRNRISSMIRNPIYVKADMEVYRFYKDQGAVLHDDPSLFVGTNGCYLYSDQKSGRKEMHLEGQHIVLAPHDGIVPSDIWIRARMKCMNNKQMTKPVKAKNTWLAGKVKCGKCGYAMVVKRSNTRIGRYLVCSRRYQTNACEGVGGIDTTALEDFVFQALTEHVRQFEIRSTPCSRPRDPRIPELDAEIEKLDREIEKLMVRVADADTILMDYINKRISGLHLQTAALRQERSDILTVESRSPTDAKALEDEMQRWGELDFDDKRTAADLLIKVIKVTETTCEITWRI